MTKIAIWTFTTTLALFSLTPQLSAQQGPTSASTNVTRLFSLSYKARQETFYSLLSSGALNVKDSDVRYHLIELLRLELLEESKAAELDSNGGHPDREDNYVDDIIYLVASFRDNRSVDVLLSVADRGNCVTDALASFGWPILEKTLVLLRDSDEAKRVAAVRIVESLLSRSSSPISVDIRVKLKQALESALTDTSFYVRIASLRSGMLLADPDVYEMVERAAINDPYEVDGTYPVREAADSLIRQRR